MDLICMLLSESLYYFIFLIISLMVEFLVDGFCFFLQRESKIESLSI